MAMSDNGNRIHEHAYHLWEKAGRPKGRELEHWLDAERELNGQGDGVRNQSQDTASDPHGIHAAEKYNHEVQQSIGSGKAERAAQEAKKAVEGPERDELKRAEEAGKRPSKGNEAAGKR
jgi:hypothetical protein